MNISPRNSNISTNTKGKKKRVFVGLSGGVDSAVSAALLKERGFDVMGVFIKVWQPDFVPCAWRDERRDAMRVCIALDIPFLFFDFETEYKKGVVEKMIEEYKLGRTPNPDILCNREVKFGAFWKKAQEMGADYIATGHYAQIQEVRSKENKVSYKLQEGKDKEKDQSYFLWTLTTEDLSHTIFPVGDMEKGEVRKFATKLGLPVAEKKDSQGICFIGEITMDEFLSHFITPKPGLVLNTKREKIGMHKGSIFYTIGERHGFEISKKGSNSGAFYVVSKNLDSNTITVSNDEPEIISLSPKKVIVKNVNWIKEPTEPTLFARIRYHGERLPITLYLSNKKLGIEFKKPVRGLSLGQSVVFYDKDVCLGGGIMDRTVSL